MDNRPVIHGTPLSKFINTEDNVRGDGPINVRKARLNQQQTVRDAQGRQRFHGAFTGGFSAGYFNTVDTVEGFAPREFISHRRNPRLDGGTSASGSGRFSHRPEDYMDEEDFGEFGIAPKQIRVSGGYTKNEPSMSSSINQPATSQLVASYMSIGETILRNMTRSTVGRRLNNETPIIDLSSAPTDSLILNQTQSQQQQFHGIGYKPLRVKSSGHTGSASQGAHPLEATLDDGKRLKISGEAFGSGVLDDDDDNDYYVDSRMAYGLDDMRDYSFTKPTSTATDTSRRSNSTHELGSNVEAYNAEDPYLLSGFVLSSKLDDMTLSDNLPNRYPLPTIPCAWKRPQRRVAVVTHETQPASDTVEVKLEKERCRTALKAKFTAAGCTLSDEDCDIPASRQVEGRVGLVKYSDLKAAAAAKAATTVGPTLLAEEPGDKPCLERLVLEWRPCSLLCKHFNVPNPFPDNLFSGVRAADLCTKPGVLHSSLVQHKDVMPTTTGVNETRISKIDLPATQPASLELKKSIFNIDFGLCSTSGITNIQQRQIYHAESLSSSDGETNQDDDEYKPQVVQINDEPDDPISPVSRVLHHQVTVLSSCESSSPDPEADVAVIPVQRVEPEVITISSSPSPCSSQNDGQDIYGPPIPTDILQATSTSNRDKQRSHKKSKRHKRDKRR